MRKNTFLAGAVLALCLLSLSSCQKEAQESQNAAPETETVSETVSTQDPTPDVFPTPEPTPTPYVFVIDADTKAWLTAIVEGISESEVTYFATNPTEFGIAGPDSLSEIKTVNAYLVRCANDSEKGYLVTIMPDGAAYVREDDREPVFRKIEIETDQIYMGEGLFPDLDPNMVLDYEAHIRNAENILKSLDLGSNRILVMSEEFEVVDHRTVIAFDIQREGREGRSEGKIFIDEALQCNYYKPKDEDKVYSMNMIRDGEYETVEEVIWGKKPESRRTLKLATESEAEATGAEAIEADDANAEVTGAEAAETEATETAETETTEPEEN